MTRFQTQTFVLAIAIMLGTVSGAIGAIIVNILCYHIFMMPAGLPLALFTAILWAFLFYCYRQNFTGLFVQKA